MHSLEKKLKDEVSANEEISYEECFIFFDNVIKDLESNLGNKITPLKKLPDPVEVGRLFAKLIFDRK